MIGGAGGILKGILSIWINMVRRAAWVVVLISVSSAVMCGWYTATRIAINTDTAGMLSPDLPFRRNELSLQEAFPELRDPLLILIEGKNADLVHAGGDKLVQQLRQRPDLFQSIQDLAGDPFFRRNGLLYLETDTLYALSDRLAEAQPFLGSLWNDPSVPGLFNLLGLAIDETRKGGDAPVEIATALEAVAQVAEAQAEGRPALLSWRGLMAGSADPLTPERRFITVKPVLDFASLAPAATAMDEVRRIAVETGLVAENGVTVRLSGTAALDHEELESVRDGLGLAGGLTVVLVLGLLALGLRSGKLVTAALVTLFAGLLWTAAFATLAVGRLNLISVAFAILFIGLSVDFGIHFSLRYREEVNRWKDHARAIDSAVRGVGGALALSAVAAAIGFFSFLPTSYVGLAELGLISGVGMFIALFANLTVLPALLTLMPLAPQESTEEEGRPFLSTETFLERHHRPVVLIALLVGLGAVALLPRARFDFDPLNLKSPKSESMQVLRDISTDPQTGAYTISVLADSLEAADTLAAQARHLLTVDSVLTLTDFVPGEQDEKLDVITSTALFLEPALARDYGATPPSADARARAITDLRAKLNGFVNGAGGRSQDSNHKAARRLLTALDALEKSAGLGDRTLEDFERRLLSSFKREVEMLNLSLSADPITLDALPPILRRRQIAADGRARVDIFPKGDMTDETELRQFVDDVRRIAPNATGAPVSIVEAGTAVKTAFAEAAALSVALITLLIAVLLRRVRSVVLVFAPLALAAALTIAASVVFALPFNFANVIVLPLLFGLGVAGGIHLVIREEQAGGAAEVLWTSTPRAVLFSALTTIGSFGSMALSGHPGTSSMGILLTLSILLTLLCTLVVLPALMSVLPGRKRLLV